MHWSIYWGAVIVTFFFGWYSTEKNMKEKGKGTVQRILAAWFTTSLFAAIQIICFLLDIFWLDLVGFGLCAFVMLVAYRSRSSVVHGV